MSIKVFVFAGLREKLGWHERFFDYVDNETVKSLYMRIADINRCELNDQGIRVAINEMFVSWDAVIQDEDDVAFISPISGG